MDRRLRFAAMAALITGLSLACTPRDASTQATKTPAGANDGAVVAEIGGKPITAGELDTWIREDLFARETANKGAAELFEFRSEALQRMLDEQLLAAEAAKQNISVDELIAKQAKSGEAVTDASVQAFYEQNKARMGSATLEQIGPRIRRFLEEQQANEGREAYVASLREKSGVAIKLQAPRVNVAAEGPARGRADAPVTIIEFSDYQCPFCKRVEPTVEAVLKKYPDQVRFVFRHFPLEQIHPRARPAAEAALCANDQGKFWEFHEKVFAGSGLEEANLVEYASAVGLDADKFKACVAERKFKDQVDADMKAGREAGVSGTPAFFVNGIMMSGAKPVEEFAEVIERELKSPAKGS
jgi:protein-disulfide isomerase